MFLVDVEVRPNARYTCLTSLNEDDIISINVDVAAPPQESKANMELLQYLKRELKMPVELVRGATSRTKRVAIDGDSETCLIKLRALL